ncbi:McrB family protein [Kaistella faecalis]|uniref:McrB family protein n=1 Tax=Kaistella faecalis TaxID=2852098 RepID=UPI001C48EAE9|nr:AAA family ATPase [Chryseobacterium faecale]UFK97706.1 AAA family ATPase [Chryseobacterium faecale]
MKYISESFVIKSWHNLIIKGAEDRLQLNKFFGVLELLQHLDISSEEPIKPNNQYNVKVSELSTSLQNKYSFDEGNKRTFTSSDILSIIFPTNWSDNLNNITLKQQKLPLEQVVAVMFQNRPFEDSQTTLDLLKTFGSEFHIEELITTFFSAEDIEIEFQQNRPARVSIISKIKELLEISDDSKHTLGFDKNLIQANPGELTRGPFIQPLYSGQENLKYIFLANFDISQFYNINSLQKAEDQTTSKDESLSSSDPFQDLTSNDIINLFASWLTRRERNKYFNNDLEKTKEALNEYSEKYYESFNEDLFKVDFHQVQDFISKLDKNLFDADTAFSEFSFKRSNHQPRAILGKENYQRFLLELENKKLRKEPGANIIYYGAPGTGKSYTVNEMIAGKHTDFVERITFHPEYDNASFVGGYKPTKVDNSDPSSDITYDFVPQAFTNIYEKAWLDPFNDYYLIIEEINRGNCAEIFGEIFQLLDRNSNYTVSPSNELRTYLIRKFNNNSSHPGITNGLKLPGNLHIYATMNTSDQSLFPMDSAFKRRWEWHYIPICYDEITDQGEPNPSYNYEIKVDNDLHYSWIDFISIVNNNHIKNNPSLGMDKCIGNYFIKPDEVNKITIKPFINKVIFYLWNDVFKDEDNIVFEENISYEEFFPVNTKGKEKIKEMFKRLGLTSMEVKTSGTDLLAGEKAEHKTENGEA